MVSRPIYTLSRREITMVDLMRGYVAMCAAVMTAYTICSLCSRRWHNMSLKTGKTSGIRHVNVQSCNLIIFQCWLISLQYSWLSVEQPSSQIWLSIIGNFQLIDLSFCKERINWRWLTFSTTCAFPWAFRFISIHIFTRT